MAEGQEMKTDNTETLANALAEIARLQAEVKRLQIELERQRWHRWVRPEHIVARRDAAE